MLFYTGCPTNSSRNGSSYFTDPFFQVKITKDAECIVHDNIVLFKCKCHHSENMHTGIGAHPPTFLSIHTHTHMHIFLYIHTHTMGFQIVSVNWSHSPDIGQSKTRAEDIYSIPQILNYKIMKQTLYSSSHAFNPLTLSHLNYSAYLFILFLINLALYYSFKISIM